jgi:hypothetical protein
MLLSIDGTSAIFLSAEFDHNSFYRVYISRGVTPLAPTCILLQMENAMFQVEAKLVIP